MHLKRCAARWRLALLVAVLPMAPGCGSNLLPVHPVSGQVLVKGKPVAGAAIMLHPQGGSQKLQELRPNGMTKADGSFVLSTYGLEDGAPAGAYKVTVVWPQAISVSTSQVRQIDGAVLFADDDPEAEQGNFGGRDQLGNRYGDPNTTPLIANIGAGPTQLPPFDLQ